MPNILKNINGDEYILLLDEIRQIVEKYRKSNTWLKTYTIFVVQNLICVHENPSKYVCTFDIKTSKNSYYTSHIEIDESDIVKLLRSIKLNHICSIQ